MSKSAQAAFTLLETLITAAVVCVAVGGLISAMGVFSRFSTHQAGPVRAASLLLAEQTLRVAQDVWKYGSPGAAPSGNWQTTVPLDVPGAAATSAPVSVTTSISESDSQGAQLTVTVQYTPDPGHAADPGRISLQGQVRVKAPLPGASVVDPSLVPQPGGAP